MATIRNSRIILGIDFGTTFSGVSWGWSERTETDAIRIVTAWKNVVEGSPEQVKVPTKIRYPGGYFPGDDDFEPDVDPRTQITWGYGIPKCLESLHWFKLLLLDDDDAKAYLSTEGMAHLARVRKMIGESGREVSDVIVDYLRLLWTHAIEQVGDSVGKRRLTEIPFTVVATVPAIWKGYVRSRMRAAIKKAGILDERSAGPTRLQFISEPEAGALATLAELQSTCSIQKGDCLTVVDVGGGTGDLISYQVVDDQKFAVTEVVEGKGALCGAIFLDQAFTELLIEEIGEDNWNKIPQDEIAEFLDLQWERGLKRQYVPGRPHHFRLTATFYQVTGKTQIKLDKDKLLKLFTSNRVITQTMKLVQEQVDGVKSVTGRAPKYIALVGGFGGSRFLKQEIENAFGGESDVLQAPPEKTWSAISRGAVMSAAKGLLSGDFAEITARIARANYGFTYETAWVDGKYDEQDKYWSSVQHRLLARNQIWWFLKKGDRSSQQEPFRVQYCRFYQPGDNFDYPDLVGAIHTYPGLNPPTRVQEGVTKACEINFTAPLPFDDLPTETSHEGGTTKVFDYVYEILAYGDSIDVTIYASGERLAGKNLSIDHELDRRQEILRVEPSTGGGGPVRSRTALSHDDEPLPPSYSSFSSVDPLDDPFADPPDTDSVTSHSTGISVIPSLIPMSPKPSPVALPKFQPLHPQNTAPSMMQPSTVSRLAVPTTVPAIPQRSSLTPVLAPTATPLVQVGLAPLSELHRVTPSGDWLPPDKQPNNDTFDPSRYPRLLGPQQGVPPVRVTQHVLVPKGVLAPINSPTPSPGSSMLSSPTILTPPISPYEPVLSQRPPSMASIGTESSVQAPSEVTSERSRKAEKQSRLRPWLQGRK